MIAKALASFLALLALATPVAAQAPTVPEPVKTGPGTRYYSGPPPVRFVKPGFVTVLFVGPDQLYEACGAPRVQGMQLMGCARMMKSGAKAIIMVHPCFSMQEQYALIFCHEAGHALGGWPGDHPL